MKEAWKMRLWLVEGATAVAIAMTAELTLLVLI
jgi:hypothetical protein